MVSSHWIDCQDTQQLYHKLYQKGGRDDRIFGRQAGTQHRLHRVEVYNLEMILVMVTTLVMEKAFLNVEGGLNLEMILVMVMVLVMEEVFLNM